MTLTVTLPLPPSANRYWRTKVVRGAVVTYVSPEADAYKYEAHDLLRKAKLKPLEGPVEASYDVWFGRNSGDLANREKVLSDVLQGFAFVDDKQIHALHMRRGIDRANPRVEITIRALAGEE